MMEQRRIVTWVGTYGGESVEAIIDLFLGLERMAPGSLETTAKAFQVAAQDYDIEKIVEFGCGSGVSTIELARLSGAPIIGVDNCAPFLAQLKQKIAQAGLDQQIQVREQSMEVAWRKGTCFDLIWCEGSAYAIGLENALQRWRELLKPGGRIALSDLVWIDTDPDAEVQEYWQNQGVTLCYPNDTLALFSSQGYQVVDYFIFPESDWQNYYQPLRARLPRWKAEYSYPENAGAIDQLFQEELRMYDQFKAQYGYAFFIAQRAP
ncbi:SAM-dependent methyltransferase [Bremerella alba]|nr:class I SAM-dependent methyltransferase [Bremerella alba]